VNEAVHTNVSSLFRNETKYTDLALSAQVCWRNRKPPLMLDW
jgi:hypothetical protein